MIPARAPSAEGRPRDLAPCVQDRTDRTGQDRTGQDRTVWRTGQDWDWGGRRIVLPQASRWANPVVQSQQLHC